MSTHSCPTSPCPICQVSAAGVAAPWREAIQRAERMDERLRRIQEMNDRIDRMQRLMAEPRLFIQAQPVFVAAVEHHRVLWSAFCLQWVAIAWCMLIGKESP